MMIIMIIITCESRPASILDPKPLDVEAAANCLIRRRHGGAKLSLRPLRPLDRGKKNTMHSNAARGKTPLHLSRLPSEQPMPGSSQNLRKQSGPPTDDPREFAPAIQLLSVIHLVHSVVDPFPKHAEAFAEVRFGKRREKG